MTGFLISAFIVSALVVFTWLSVRALDGDRNATIALCFMVFLLLGLLINYNTKKEAVDPCLEYKTQMMYNAAKRGEKK